MNRRHLLAGFALANLPARPQTRPAEASAPGRGTCRRLPRSMGLAADNKIVSAASIRQAIT